MNRRPVSDIGWAFKMLDLPTPEFPVKAETLRGAGKISVSRHSSYIRLYELASACHPWEKKTPE